MIKQVKRICPICGCIRAEVITQILMDLPKYYNLPKNYSVVSCEKCGFCYADTEATKEDYDNYYKNCNNYNFSLPLLLEGESTFNKLYPVIQKFLNTESKILDMGFGSGDFLLQLKEHNYTNIVGIDPSKESVGHLCQKGIKALQGEVYGEVSTELIGRFDAVFLLAVLEHLLEPQLALKQLAKYLDSAGEIFIVVPNVECIQENKTPLPNNFNQEHINYFSPYSLRNMMKSIGFKEVLQHNFIYKGTAFDEDAIIGVYTKAENIVIENLEKDTITSQSIKEYLNKEEEKEIKRGKLINRLKEDKIAIMIWGIGAFTNTLFASTDLDKCNVIAFIDNHPSKIGTIFRGKQVISPKELIYKKETIVICSMLSAKYIEKQIKEMNISNEIIILQ